MKKLILSFTFIILVLYSYEAKSQITNADFTNWVTDSLGRLDPASWKSSNLKYTRATIHQDTDRLGGAGYSVKFDVVYDSSAGYYQGGEIDLINAAYSGPPQPNGITGYWKFHNPQVSDLLYIDLNVYDSGQNLIGNGSINTPFTGSITSWVQFSVPIAYTSANAVSSYSINFLVLDLSGDSTINGQVDDLAFDFSSGVNNPVDNKNKPFVYRNGDAYNLNWISENPETVKIELINSNGKLERRIFNGRSLQGLNSINSDLSSLAGGVYYFLIQSDSGTQVCRLLK